MLIAYKKPRGRFFIVGKPGSGPGPVPVPQPDDELWYTTSDGNPVDLSGASFNANVASHTYTGGKGVIKFDANLTEIGANSFENADIVTVSFPDTLTTIGASAFDSCPITELDLKNVQSLGMEAFDYNYVSALHIPASVNSINRNPFRTPYGNQTITVDSNNTTYSDGGGCNCVYDETTHTLVVGGPNSTVPTGCTTIGEFAFSNCYGLTSIEFPASVTSIKWLAFGSDEQGNLATIRAHSVPTFEPLAFMSVADNGTLYLDAGLDPTDWMNALPAGWTLVQPCNVSISAGANGLVSVNGGTPTSSYTGTVNYGTQITIQAIPDTDYEFDSWSDGDSTNPRTLTVTSNVTLSAAFQEAVPVQPNDEVWYTTSDGQTITPYQLKDANGNYLLIVSNTYTDGKGVAKMSGDIVGTNNSFASQPTLTSISLPSSLTSIGASCFISCTSLASVTIPDSVTTIGNNAFYYCTSLAAIESLATTAPTISTATFRNVAQNGILTVPSGADYSVWMQTSNYYLGLYNWTLVQQ